MTILERPDVSKNCEARNQGRYERFNLRENPFPSEPTVNMNSDDKRINGGIFETEIRKKEINQLINNFIKKPQTDRTHYRMGFIIDTSYIGRGNGKSAFLINLLNKINTNFCLDLSNKVNKCFGVYFSPEPSGRTKHFSSFVDQLFKSLIQFNIIKYSLMLLRLEVIQEMNKDIIDHLDLENYSKLADEMATREWYLEKELNINEIENQIRKRNPILRTIPLFNDGLSLFSRIVNQDDFIEYYKTIIKKKDQKNNFVFSDLVKLFRVAGFTGGYIFVDDYERIPDFQSTRQKKDFALELRSVLYDGLYESAKYGFYVLFLVLHAGVPRLINDSWVESGMDHRAPINELSHNHIIQFNKLDISHVSLLLQKYIKEYRINETSDLLYPFTEEVIQIIAEKSENNAARILKSAYELLEKAANDETVKRIDSDFEKRNSSDYISNSKTSTIFDDKNVVNLIDKAKGE